MCNNYINRRKLILASSSPRRKQLLEEAGFWFDVRPIDIDETFPNDMALESVASYIAEKKANAAQNFIQENEI